MEHVLTDYTGEHHTFAYQYDCFEPQELNTLQEIARSAQDPVLVGPGSLGTVSDNVRRSNLKWVHNSRETLWIYHKLSHHVSNLNSRFFQFKLTGFGEALQFTNYNSTDHGMYNWHVDFGGICSRKLSIVLQLSDPADYEGGSLQLNTGNSEIITIEKRRGMLVAFPSWTLHQVTPVTQGTRQSLVAWLTGPRFA